ncbi:hypothetical protein Tco_0808181 [Tanacetum coccineum]
MDILVRLGELAMAAKCRMLKDHMLMGAFIEEMEKVKCLVDIIRRDDNHPLCLIRLSIVCGKAVCYSTSKVKNMVSYSLTQSSMDLSNMEQLLNQKLQLHLQPSEIEDMMSSQTHKRFVKVKLLIEGSEISLHERESKLYDDFDTFISVSEETTHSYYLRFAQLINDMLTIGTTMKPIQVNTKFINHLQPKWSKFMTDVKFAKDLYNTKFDHLYGYLRQREAHTNEVRQIRQRYPDPLALVANTYNSSPSYTKTQYHQQISPIARLVVQSLLLSDDLIASLNKAMANQATIQDGRVIVQNVQGRQTQGPTAFQTDDLDVFDFDCDETPSASVVLMAKLSAYDSDVLLEVPNHDTNIISYELYVKETENTVVQDTSYSTQHDALIMSVIEKMSNQAAKCNEVDKVNKTVNESLTAKLERYKEQIKFFKRRQKFDLTDREKYIDCQLREVIVDRNAKHDALSVIDTEETLTLAQESRLKMHAKQNDQIEKDKKINIKPIDYAALNKFSEHFVKIVQTERRDDVTNTKRRRQDFQGDGVKDLATASEHS